jgi:fibronectin type 3 domain-containing protein
VSDETTYYYVVSATNAAGEGALSPQVPAVATAPRAPAAPTGVRVVRADAIYDLSQGGNGFLAGGEILISWNAAAGATSYTITRTPCLTGVEEGPCPIATQLANKTSYLDIGEVFFPPDPQVGISYTYSVQASNSFGSSSASAAVSVTPAVKVPDAPTAVTAKVGFGGVLVQWTPPFGMLPNFGPMQYNVYRGTASAGPFSLVTQISTATFVDKTAPAGSTYYYVVTAAKGGDESAQSRPARISL